MNQEHNNWYALYTSPRAEKQVKDRLEREGVEVYLPLHLSPRKWSDRIKMVEVPLFNSYIFVKIEESRLRELLKVYGVSRIVYYSGKPAVVQHKEIEQIRLFLEKAAEKELSMGIGDEVMIACGPLKEMSGKIQRVGKRFLILQLEQLGVSVSVDLTQVIRK